MTIDDKRNVYLTSGKIWVYNKNGELIKEIETPEKPANVCFGGEKKYSFYLLVNLCIL